jgi:hypothetical protein
MSDDRDPQIHDALQRLARSAPAPRPDRLAAVVAGARRRQQARVALSTLTGVAVVAAAALGVHTWRDTAVQQTGPSLGSSQSPSGPAGSPTAATSGSPVQSPESSIQVGAVPAPTSTGVHSAKAGLVVTVTTAASVPQGAPATVVMRVTNKGSVTTHGGAFVVQHAYAADGATTVSSAAGSISSQCRSESQGLTCDVGTLKPGQSRTFSDSISASATATSIVFEVRWEYSPPTGNPVSTGFHRVVKVTAAAASSPVSSPVSPPPDSGAPGSGVPSSPGAPSSTAPTPPSSPSSTSPSPTPTSSGTPTPKSSGTPG